MKILYISTRRAKPSFRFRVEQVLPFFQDCGHECEVAFLPRSLWKRFALYRRMSRFDVVVIQKRLLSPVELAFVRGRAPRLVYDVDDAVMFNGAGVAEGKRQSRFRSMVGAADLTICGNDYLAREAARHSPRTVVIPTPIDTHRFRPPESGNGTKSITIGWTGSRSTNRYLNDLFPTLARLPGEYGVRIISDTTEGFDFAKLGDVAHTFVRWSPGVEISSAATFDVGVMPLPDDPWTRGKCGFKALQYMSLGIPPVCSPVGVNTAIVNHGEDGFLAGSPPEWFECLSALLGDAALRRRLGRAARRRMESTFALDVVGPRFVAAVTAANLDTALSA